MKLLTEEIKKTLPPLYSQENETDPLAHIKYFTPDSGWSWYVLEGQKQEDGDWLFFAKVVSPIVPEGEIGYVCLSQLKEIRGSLGLPVERDLWFKATPISQCK